MNHKHSLEALHKTMQDLKDSDQIFTSIAGSWER